MASLFTLSAGSGRKGDDDFSNVAKSMTEYSQLRVYIPKLYAAVHANDLRSFRPFMSHGGLKLFTI